MTSVGNDTTDIHETAAGDSSPNSDAPPCQLNGTWRPPSFFITAAEAATAQSVEALHALLGEVTPDGLLASSAEEAELRVSDGDAPVPALRFDPVDAVDLLSDLHDRSHARLDRSLRFWSLAARYLVSLIEREQFAPDISVTAENTFEGRWRLFVLVVCLLVVAAIRAWLGGARRGRRSKWGCSVTRRQWFTAEAAFR